MGWSEFDEEEAQAIQARVDAEVAAAVLAEREACATVIKEAGLAGMDSLLLMAAVVEMTEPSNAKVEADGAASCAGRASNDGLEVLR